MKWASSYRKYGRNRKVLNSRRFRPPWQHGRETGPPFEKITLSSQGPPEQAILDSQVRRKADTQGACRNRSWWGPATFRNADQLTQVQGRVMTTGCCGSCQNTEIMSRTSQIVEKRKRCPCNYDMPCIKEDDPGWCTKNLLADEPRRL